MEAVQMTMTQKAAEIRIASGFLSALDKCPNCGDEHDVASQVECRACGYHAGSDLSQEWLGHVEEEMKSIPAGVELVFAHETESGDSDYYYDFSVSPDAGSAAVLAFFERIAGGASEAAIINRDHFALDMHMLQYLRLEMATNYSAPPLLNTGVWREYAGSGRYAHITRMDLERIQREIEGTQATAVQGSYDCDSKAAAWALAHNELGRGQMSKHQKIIELIHNKLMNLRDSTPWRRGSMTREREYVAVYLRAYKQSRLREFYAAAERYRYFLQEEK
jgi:hypothetical protein